MYPLGKILVPHLRRLGATPNGLTISNIFVGLTTSYLVYKRWWFWAFLFVYAHNLLDAMDGTMARMFSMQSPLGAKLDEFTDIFFSVHLGLVSFLFCFPDAILCSLIVIYALAVFAGNVAWSQGGKDKRYVDELNLIEFWGLWNLENQSYNLWSLELVFVVIDKSREAGLIPESGLLQLSDTGGKLFLFVVPAVAIGLVFFVSFRHYSVLQAKDAAVEAEMAAAREAEIVGFTDDHSNLSP